MQPKREETMTYSDTPSGANRNSKASATKAESNILRDLIYSYINDFLETKPSNPTAASSNHTEYQKPPYQDENHSQLLQDTEKRRLHAKYYRAPVYPHTHETSHCRICGNSQDTLDQVHTSSHQTNTDLEAYVQILYQIRDLILELHENLNPSVEQSQVLSSLLSTP